MSDTPAPARSVPFARWVGVVATAVVLARLGQLLPMGTSTVYLAATAYGVPLAAGLLLGRWAWTAVLVGGLFGAVAVPAHAWVGVTAATAAALFAGQRCRRGWPFNPALRSLSDIGRLAWLATEVAVVQGLVTGLLATAADIPGGVRDGVTAVTLALASNVILGAVAGGLRAGSVRPFLTVVPLVAVVGLLAVTRLLDRRYSLAHEPAAVWWLVLLGLAAAALGLLALAAVARERLAEAALRERLLADLKSVSADLIRRRAAMEALLDQLPVGVLFLDHDGHVVRQNRQYRDGLRLPTDFPELQPDQPTDSGRWRVARADGSPVSAADWSVYRAVRERKVTTDREARVLAADGVWRDVSISSAPVTDPDNDGSGSVFVVSDLTARKQAERDRRAAEDRLRGALDSARMYAWEWEPATDRVEVFGDFRRVVGLPADRPVPRTSAEMLAFTHPADLPGRAELLAAVRAGQRTEYEVEYRVARADESVVWLAARGQAVRHPDGTLTGRFAGVTSDITARKLAEERAADAEARARFALSAARMTAWEWDVATGRVSRSEPLHRFLGLPDDQPLDHSSDLLAYIHPADRPRLGADPIAFAASGREFEWDYRVRHADGTWRWLRTRGRGLPGASGRVERVAGVHIDVTAEKTAEDRLRLLESAVVHARDAVIILDAEPTPTGGRAVRYANAAFERITGYAPAEVTGRSLSILGGPQSDPDVLGRLRAALTAGQPLVTELLNYHKDGAEVWVELSLVPVPDPAGAVSHFVMIQRDITDRKQAEEALRQSEERFRTMFENAAAGVSETGPDGRYVAANPAFATLLGRPPDAIIGHHASAFTHPDDWAVQRSLATAAVTAERDQYHCNKRYLRPDGTVVWTELSAAVLRDPAGRVRFTLGVSVDVTERRRLEEQLRQAQKMEAVGQLAGGIAHDFNNLLTGVIGHLGLVELPAADPNRVFLATAEKAAHRAAELTQKLLGFARKNQLLLAPVPASSCVTEVLDLVRPNLGKAVTLVADIATTDPVLADPALIGQVVLNLCLNARDAMPAGGTLTVGTAAVTVTPAEAAAHPHGRPGPHVRIRVADTGTGMTPEVLARVFEPFFTTKGVGKGTGLGLAMVDGIVRQHGGWVTVASAVGVGTRFDIYLKPAGPATPGSTTVLKRSLAERVAPTDLSDTPRPRPTTPGTVLLVDDEEMIRQLGRNVLEDAGYTVLEAEDGADALDLFRRRHADIDLVVMDLTMPHMSGREAFRQMADIRPSARVLLSSGYSADDLSDVVGAAGLLAKPYRPAELIAAVRQALDKPAG